MFLGANAWGQELIVNGGFESWDNSTTPTGWDKIESITQGVKELLIDNETKKNKK
jgi:hypothetical protein